MHLFFMFFGFFVEFLVQISRVFQIYQWMFLIFVGSGTRRVLNFAIFMFSVAIIDAKKRIIAGVGELKFWIIFHGLHVV